MSPSRIFILRPVATTLLMAAIMLVGIFAYRFLPLSALPEVDYPTIQVQTFYPGASPDVMTSSVTAPLEVQFGQMPGLNQMSSTSSAGASVITLQFSLALSLDVAEQEVQAAINAAGNLLPSDLPAPPIYAKVNPADAPILTLALTSKTISLTQVQDLADTRLAQKISQLPGVGLVSVSGGQRPAVRIQANYRQLAAYGLNIDDLRTTLATANVNTPKGNFDGPSQAHTINANDQIRKAADYNDLVVAYRNGAPVKLSDVARATEGPENTKLAAWMNTDRAIILNIQRQPGANVIEVVDRIQALLPQLRAALPTATDVELQAALKGSAQIGFTIISLTVSLIAVLIPLLFMPDVVGRLFREFAITLGVTIVISAVVALTLVPMMCAKILRHRRPAEMSWLARNSQEWFDSMIAGYGRLLRAVLAHQPRTLLVAVATLLLTVFLYIVIPKGFFPIQDTGLIQGISEASPSVSFDAMARRQQELAAVILKDPDVASLSSFIGVDGTNPTLNTGRFLVNLKPRDQRRTSASDVIRRLTRETQDVAGIALFMQPVQDLTIDATVSRSQYNFVLEDANPNEFTAWVPKLLDRLQQIPELEDVTSNFGENGLSAYIQIDRATAARFGITPATVDNALYDSFGQRIVSTIFTQTNQYRVILEADPEMQQSLSSLGSIYLPSSTAANGQVPLSAIAEVKEQTAPLQIDHLGQFPSTTVSFNLAKGAALGEAVNAIKQAEQEIGMPASMITVFQGAALAFQAALGNELMLIIAAIITMYIVLGVLYESFIHPVTILSTLPSAGVGALLALMLARHARS